MKNTIIVFFSDNGGCTSENKYPGIEENLYLYNLDLDISESTNLKAVIPEKLKELHSLLKKWQKEVNAELPVPNSGFN